MSQNKINSPTHSKAKYNNDKSDRKSLDNLIEKLLHEQTISKSPSRKQAATNPRSSLQKRLTRRNLPAQSSKITNWLSKEKALKEKESIKLNLKKENKKSTKKKQPNTKLLLDITINNKKTSNRKLVRSKSFEKYGVIVPSFDKIVTDQKRFDDHKKCLELFDSVDDEVFDKSIEIHDFKASNEFSGEILGCKHLSSIELNDAFDKHYKLLKGIFKGKIYNERHQQYHNFDAKFCNTTKDLTHSASMFVFTDEQKDHLVRLMSAKFDPDDKHTDYFFKVLLAELCLLIFMDVHDMEKQEAVKYLNERPLD